MAKQESVQSQGEKDRARELERRRAREEAAKHQSSIIVHPPTQK